MLLFQFLDSLTQGLNLPVLFLLEEMQLLPTQTQLIQSRTCTQTSNTARQQRDQKVGHTHAPLKFPIYLFLHAMLDCHLPFTFYFDSFSWLKKTKWHTKSAFGKYIKKTTEKNKDRHFWSEMIWMDCKPPDVGRWCGQVMWTGDVDRWCGQVEGKVVGVYGWGAWRWVRVEAVRWHLWCLLTRLKMFCACRPEPWGGCRILWDVLWTRAISAPNYQLRFIRQSNLYAHSDTVRYGLILMHHRAILIRTC